MGFSGGGSNVLLPHTHDGTVSQDGGPLNFNNITQSQSAAGQVFFSDGNHLQQLAIGGALDQLRVNGGATAPEWFTPTPAAGPVLTRTSLTSAVQQSTTSLTPIDATTFTMTCGATTGKAIPFYQTAIEGTNDGFLMFDYSVDGAQTQQMQKTHGGTVPAELSGVTDTTNSQVIKVQFGLLAAGTMYLQRSSYNGTMYVLEIS